jgi:nitrogen-specific signal transduction histidine kinase/ActR/RegA family two-component response regulator
VFRDITERRKAEQEKESLEAQLRQAQKMEALGTLAGGIAHDFNNILSVIIGNSEILDLADAVSPAARDSLAQITAAAQRAKQLVKQILAFSRHARQEKMVINLKPIVKETIDFLRASLPATIRVKHYLDPGAGQILADPTQMQQVLMNLCTNAGHAMEADGGTLEITLGNVAPGDEDERLRPVVRGGGSVRLSVSDTGSGIDPAVLPHIFEPYFTTKGPGKGTGLGLSVVHGIVASHDGTIRVDSEPGRGTVFHVHFPLADRPVTPETAENQPLPRGSGRILFVDDEPELADLGSRMLRSLGYEVESRTSPIEALEAFRADPGRFDLVITDLTMPNMTGLKLAGHLGEIRPGTPVVLCTGFSDHANEQRARELGMRAFLFKPLLMRDLALAVRKAMDEPAAGGSHPNPA